MEYINAIHKPAKLSERLQYFYKHDFATFISELKKQKVKLTAEQELELMLLFEEKKSEVDALSHTINSLDNELDEIVFELYGINGDERKNIFLVLSIPLVSSCRILINHFNAPAQ